MSHTNRNFVVAYVLLVGLPLLGLAGVLRTGRTLRAPISVDGVWKMDASAAHTSAQPSSAQPCDKVLSSLVGGPMGISQSGSRLVLTFNASKTITSATLEGRTLKTTFPPAQDASGATACGHQKLALTAMVDPTTDPRSLSGQLTVNGCEACAPLDFRATRHPRAATVGAD